MTMSPLMAGSAGTASSPVVAVPGRRTAMEAVDNALPTGDGVHDGGGDGDSDTLDPDNVPEPPEQQPHLWPTSSLTKTIADLRRGLAQLVSPPPEQKLGTTSTPIDLDSTSSTTAMGSSTTSATSTAQQDDSPSGGLLSPSFPEVHVDVRDDVPEDAPDAYRDLFRIPYHYAVAKWIQGDALTTTTTTTTPSTSRRPSGLSVVMSRSVENYLNARRLIQLTGPGNMDGSSTGSGSADVLGLSRPFGGPLGVTPNMTGVVGQRGSVAGTLAGSLHGGVNVLLGGAMLSGLILLVFFICYCCQRSARKSDAHFRTTYWLPDPDGPLEVFTLDAQSQRLERAGAVFLPPESVDVVSSSPPPAYHTVVNLPPLCSGADGAGGAGGAGAKLPDASSAARDSCIAGLDAITIKLAGVSGASCGGEVDADGLPSYEAALKLECQGHI